MVVYARMFSTVFKSHPFHISGRGLLEILFSIAFYKICDDNTDRGSLKESMSILYMNPKLRLITQLYSYASLILSQKLVEGRDMVWSICTYLLGERFGFTSMETDQIEHIRHDEEVI